MIWAFNPTKIITNLEIQSLAVDSINKMQVICKSLCLARYEQDIKAMGAPQNQIIPPSHNSSMQQLLNWVKDSFVAPKSLPPLWMLSHKILLSPKSDVVCEKQLGKNEVGILRSFYLIILDFIFVIRSWEIT